VAAEIKVVIHGPVTLTLNDHSSGAPDYLLRNTSKLLEGPDPEQTTTPRQGEHGVRTSLSQYGARTLVFEGEILGDDQGDRKTLEDLLKQGLSLRALQSYAGPDGFVLVEITDEDGSLKQCYAKIASRVTIDVTDDDPARRGFSFVMLAKDSFLYSQTLRSASGEETFAGTSFTVVQGASPTFPFQLSQSTRISATCDNQGTGDAAPVVTISGPTTSPKVTNVTTGKFIELTGLTLEADESVTIDVGQRTIRDQDDNDLSAYWGSGSTWWVLQAGENEITLLDASPDEIEATCLIQWRDTYI
jgi:phage-related protein